MNQPSDQTVLRVETRSLRVHLWATLTLGILGFVAYAVTSVAATQLDGAISYAGALTVDEQDDIRAQLLAELRQRIGPVRMNLVFTRRPIHDPPRPA